MALKTFGSGWDPNDSLAPDNSGAPPFQDDVDLPPWQGGGKGFGGGGPLVPSQGTTLTTTPPAPNRGAPGPGFGVGGSWNPSNWFRANPNATFAPGEQLNGPGGPAAGGNFPLTTGFGKAGLWGLGAEGMRRIIEPQPLNVGEDDAIQKALRGRPGREVTPPQTYPHAPWPDTGVAPTPATYPHMPWPDTGATPGVGSAVPAVPPPRPGSAVTAQRPDLGTYAAPPPVIPNSPFTTLDYRPNSGPNERNRGSPVATALDLSRFFGGGQPAPAAAPAAAAPAVPYPPPRPLVANLPSSQVVAPGPEDASIIARQKMRRFKGSSSSQGGGQ